MGLVATVFSFWRSSETRVATCCGRSTTRLKLPAAALAQAVVVVAVVAAAVAAVVAVVVAAATAAPIVFTTCVLTPRVD